MNLDMDSKTLEIKNTSEATKWTIYRHVSPSDKINGNIKMNKYGTKERTTLF